MLPDAPVAELEKLIEITFVQEKHQDLGGEHIWSKYAGNR